MVQAGSGFDVNTGAALCSTVAAEVAEVAAEVAEVAAEILVVRLDWGVGNLVYCYIVVQVQ